MVCERVLIIHRGRLVTQARMDDLTKAGGRSLEEAFMDAISSEAEVAA